MEAAELSTASPSAMDVIGAGGKGKHLGTGYPGRDKARGPAGRWLETDSAALLGWYPSASQKLTDKDSLILTCTHLPLELLAPRQKQNLAGPYANSQSSIG